MQIKVKESHLVPDPFHKVLIDFLTHVITPNKNAGKYFAFYFLFYLFFFKTNVKIHP